VTGPEEELLVSAPSLESGAPALASENQGLASVRGFFATWRAILSRPEEFFRDLGETDGAQALAFGLVAKVAGWLLCFYWYLLLTLGLICQVGAGSAQILSLDAGSLAILILLTPLLVLANLVVSSLCLWGGAGLVGCRPDFASIWRITCYGQAGMAGAVIPLLGGPVAVLWVLFLYYQGVQQVFGVTPGRALAALVVFLVLSALLLLVFLGSLTILVGVLLLLS
jgi:hypothetical protein